MKKVILLFSLIIILAPYKAFAYTDGLTNGQIWYRSDSPEGLESKVSDNNVSQQFRTGYKNSYFEYDILKNKNAVATVTGFIVKSEDAKSLRVEFYDAAGQLIKSIQDATLGRIKLETRNIEPVEDVARVRVVNTITSTQLFWEFDLFGTLSAPPLGGLLDGKMIYYGNSINSNSNSTGLLTNNIDTDGITLSGSAGSSHTIWTNFDNPMEIRKVYSQGQLSGGQYEWQFYGLNNTLLKNIPWTGNGWVDIDPVKHVRKIALVSKHDKSIQITEFNTLGVSIPPVNYSELADLKLSPSDKSVGLTWVIPENHPDFTGTAIYKNGAFLASVDSHTSTFSDIKVTPETAYEYRVSAVYIDGYGTPGLNQNTKTLAAPLPSKDVKNVEVKPFHNRVNLSWNLPEDNGFHHVNIYRDEIKKIGFIKGIISGTTVYAAETPIFETNGTYFNDLSVKPSTEYEYTLKTESKEGIESEGVTVQTITPKKPVPDLEGGGYEKDENGDFLFTWTSPTTGKVKVMIDGKEYKTVDASLKQIFIPKGDMKYDIFNNPKVTLIPITEDGKEGTPTKPDEGGGSGEIGGGKLPFGPTDLLKSTVGLLGVIAPILLLSLAIIFFKPIKNVIVKSVQTHRERKMYR